MFGSKSSNSTKSLLRSKSKNQLRSCMKSPWRDRQENKSKRKSKNKLGDKCRFGLMRVIRKWWQWQCNRGWRVSHHPFPSDLDVGTSFTSSVQNPTPTTLIAIGSTHTWHYNKFKTRIFQASTKISLNCSDHPFFQVLEVLTELESYFNMVFAAEGDIGLFLSISRSESYTMLNVPLK